VWGTIAINQVRGRMSAHTPTLKSPSTAPHSSAEVTSDSSSRSCLKDALRTASYAGGCELLRPIQMKDSESETQGASDTARAGWSFVTGQRAGPVAHRATVYFRDREVDVTGDGPNILREVADAYSSDAGSMRVLTGVVQGFADALPSVAPSNVQLAEQRARNTRDAVAHAFLKIGLRPSQLSIGAVGHGDADSARDPRCGKKMPEALAEYRRAKVLIWESPTARSEKKVSADAPSEQKSDDKRPPEPAAMPPVPKPRAIGGTRNMDTGVAAVRAGRHDHARQMAATYVSALVRSGSSSAWAAQARLGIKITPTKPPTWDARMAGIEMPRNATKWQASALRMDTAYREWVYWDDKVLRAGGSWARAEDHPTEANKQILATEAGYMFFAADRAKELALELLK